MRTINKDIKLDKTRLDFGKRIERRYGSELMKVTEGIEWTGSFEYKKDNGFAFINVDNNIGFQCESVLKNEDFKVRYTIRKNKFPGKTF